MAEFVLGTRYSSETSNESAEDEFGHIIRLLFRIYTETNHPSQRDKLSRLAKSSPDINLALDNRPFSNYL